MKKHNLFVLTLLNISILIVAIVSFLTTSIFKPNDSITLAKIDFSSPSATLFPTASSDANIADETITPTENTQATQDAYAAKLSEAGEYTIDQTNTLFIGDSRAVGLMEYGGNDLINFFSDVGMSLYKMDNYALNVKDKGKLTLNELLTNYQYQTIFIMLGLNDLGYNFESLTNHYSNLVSTIAQVQPNSKIILIKNLHLTANRSDYDATFNNSNINLLNNFIATLADNTNIYCIDTNHYYDDQYGNLNTEYSNDDTHLYAKYYTQWLQQIIDDSTNLINQS